MKFDKSKLAAVGSESVPEPSFPALGGNPITQTIQQREKPKAVKVAISLPPDLLEDARNLAKAKGCTLSRCFQEAMQHETEKEQALIDKWKDFKQSV